MTVKNDSQKNHQNAKNKIWKIKNTKFRLKIVKSPKMKISKKSKMKIGGKFKKRNSAAKSLKTPKM